MNTVQSIAQPARGLHFEASPNRLLAALPDDAFDRIAPELTFRRFRSKELLHKTGEPVREIYFPGRGLYSITTMNREGAIIEITSVGPEGFLGIGAVLGAGFAMNDTSVQIEGDGAHILPVTIFNREVGRPGPFRDAMWHYTRAFVAILMHSVACNGLHSVEARCCRWLLDAVDRVEGSELWITHEELGMLLGVRRPTITLVMSELAHEGAIKYVRGRVRILDRQRLEAGACECYRKNKALTDLAGVTGLSPYRSA